MIDYLKSSRSSNFFLLAGPCVIEGEQMAIDIAGYLVEVCKKHDIPLVFKGSYRKANRSRFDSFTSIGDEKALLVLQKVRNTFNIPIITDIHESHEAAMVAPYVDVIQIPAFLCRQTKLLSAAAETGRAINIKKGQFLSPESMKFAVEKVRQCGNHQVMVTDRGTTFGYQDLVIDFRAIPIMQQVTGCPTILDVTHSLQQPNQTSGVTGGLPNMIEMMARAAVAVGVDGLFMETHTNPLEAKSDGKNMLPIDKIDTLLSRLVTIRHAVLS